MPLCFVILDIGDGDRIVSPGMCEENLTVDTELLIKLFLVPLGALRDISHSEHVGFFQPAGLTGTEQP